MVYSQSNSVNSTPRLYRTKVKVPATATDND